jgi:hypothetical protein
LQGRRSRQGEFHTGAIIAVDEPRVTAVPASDPPADGEARADAGIGVLAIETVEHAEGLVAVGRLDARPIVADPKPPEVGVLDAAASARLRNMLISRLEVGVNPGPERFQQ